MLTVICTVPLLKGSKFHARMPNVLSYRSGTVRLK